MLVHFILNGEPQQCDVHPSEPLSQLLRNQFQLIGTKIGCGQGDCGACSVWFNGQLVNSCLLPQGKLEGAHVITIEGLAQPNALHPIQECFIANGAVQCGYCTPGMVMAAYALLKMNPDPDEQAIRTAISGNLCRCTGYNAIINAIQQAAAWFRTHPEVKL